MNDELRNQRIEYRLLQADDSLQEAEALFRVALYRGAVNRAYYAMFYAILALSVFKGQVLSKHSGAIAFFDLEFIKSGVLPKQLSKILHLAFDQRQANDYGELWSIDQTETEQAIRNSREFVAKVVELLRSAN